MAWPGALLLCGMVTQVSLGDPPHPSLFSVSLSLFLQGNHSRVLSRESTDQALFRLVAPTPYRGPKASLSVCSQPLKMPTL